jgi:hypothetical protein
MKCWKWLNKFVSNLSRDFNFYAVMKYTLLIVVLSSGVMYLSNITLLFCYIRVFHIKVNTHSIDYMLCTDNRTALFVNVMVWF